MFIGMAVEPEESGSDNRLQWAAGIVATAVIVVMLLFIRSDMRKEAAGRFQRAMPENAPPENAEVRDPMVPPSEELARQLEQAIREAEKTTVPRRRGAAIRYQKLLDHLVQSRNIVLKTKLPENAWHPETVLGILEYTNFVEGYRVLQPVTPRGEEPPLVYAPLENMFFAHFDVLKLRRDDLSALWVREATRAAVRASLSMDLGLGVDSVSALAALERACPNQAVLIAFATETLAVRNQALWEKAYTTGSSFDPLHTLALSSEGGTQEDRRVFAHAVKKKLGLDRLPPEVDHAQIPACRQLIILGGERRGERFLVSELSPLLLPRLMDAARE